MPGCVLSVPPTEQVTQASRPRATLTLVRATLRQREVVPSCTVSMRSPRLATPVAVSTVKSPQGRYGPGLRSNAGLSHMLSFMYFWTKPM